MRRTLRGGKKIFIIVRTRRVSIIGGGEAGGPRVGMEAFR